MKKKILLFIIGIVILTFTFVNINLNNVNQSNVVQIKTEHKNENARFAMVSGLDIEYHIYDNERYGSGGGGGGGYFGAAGAAIGLALAGATLGAVAENTVPVNSTPEPPSRKTIDLIISDYELKQIADKTLSELDDDYGWTSDELAEALEKAIHLPEALVNATIETIRNFKLVLYLGVFENNSDESYEKVAQENDGTYFSMSDEDWDRYLKIHQEIFNPEDISCMWPLNKFFLDWGISKDCDFVLVTNPNKYYNSSTKEIYKINGKVKSYSKELWYINQFGYNWIVNDYEKNIHVKRKVVYND